LQPGDPVRLTNGAGTLADATLDTIAKSSCIATIARTEAVSPPRSIHLRVPIADRERMLWLAEKTTELGLSSWQAVRWTRSMSVSPRGEGDAFRAKLRARMISALEQSGGAWLPKLLDDTEPNAIDLPSDALPLVLDVNGGGIAGLGALLAMTVAFGPEGGFTPEELAGLRNNGWRPTALAATTLRFETAGIAAVACLRAKSLASANGLKDQIVRED